MSKFQPTIDIDLRAFERDFKNLHGRDFPKAMAKGIRILAENVLDDSREQLDDDLNISSRWLPKQLRAFPSTNGQENKVAKDIKTKHKFNAQVNANQKIVFMTSHNVGMERHGSKGQRIAVPGPGLLKYSYKTRSGRVKKSYRPDVMLKDWQGNRTTKERTGKKTPFFFRSAKSDLPMIGKRSSKRSRPFEVMWFFVKEAQIKKDWQFTEAGEKSIKRHYSRDIMRGWDSIRAMYPDRS